MTQRIEADWEKLFSQAKDSGQSYLSRAVEYIIKELGEDVLKSHPELAVQLAVIMQRDFTTATYGVMLQNIGDALEGIAASLSGNDE